MNVISALDVRGAIFRRGRAGSLAARIARRTARENITSPANRSRLYGTLAGTGWTAPAARGLGGAQEEHARSANNRSRRTKFCWPLLCRETKPNDQTLSCLIDKGIALRPPARAKR